MKVIAINEVELDILEGLTTLQVKVYLILRRRMDYFNGEVSTTYLQLITYMTPATRKGVAKETITKDRLRNALSSLEKTGLLEKQAGDYLVFLLPKAEKVNPRLTRGQPEVNQRSTKIEEQEKQEQQYVNEGAIQRLTRGQPEVSQRSTRGTHPIKEEKKRRREVEEEQIKDQNIYSKIPAPTVEKPEDIQQEAWDVFLTHRKNKKASMIPKIIERVILKFRAASAATGKSIDEIIYFYVEKNWTGFEVEWMVASTTTQTPNRRNKNTPQTSADIDKMLEGIVFDDTPSGLIPKEATGGTRPIKVINPELLKSNDDDEEFGPNKTYSWLN